VNQEALEKHDLAPAGKYTVGLGQTNMTFCGDREDIVSICLTAVQSLLEKYSINPKSIGRLEVGTETIIDKSKSVKTSLMQLFKDSGNMNLEGIDNLNACYGGTSALFNSVQWIESSYWDGRYALVVAGDIAVYAEGNARPTGGCGVVAMLIGPNAPIVMDRGLRGVHMEHVYDFYKPNLDSEYPVVDGKLSVECYLRAVDNCYARYRDRFEKQEGKKFDLSQVDYVVFHAPYNKLVQKSLSRLVYNDFLRDSSNPKYAPLAEFNNVGLGEKSYVNPKLDQALSNFSKPTYQQKTVPSTVVPKQLGNIYCGSLYAGLLSVISEVGDGLIGKRVLMFSYGSGLASSFFSFSFRASIKYVNTKMDVKNRLAKRINVQPEQFVKTLQLREKRHGAKDYTPSDPIDTLLPGTFYLTKVDSKLRRSYARKPLIHANL
jgi:hydroxymethylglutaryl-CoA synthase